MPLSKTSIPDFLPAMKKPALLALLASATALIAADPIKVGEYASLTGKEAGFRGAGRATGRLAGPWAAGWAASEPARLWAVC